MRTDHQTHLSAYDAETHHGKSAPRIIALFTTYLSLFFFLAVPAAVLFTGEGNFLGGLIRILTTPSKLVTDYFALGGLAPTLFNTAVCGYACNWIIWLSRVKSNATTLAAYLLVVAHGFYGLNFLNMWPPLLGVLLFCLITRRPFRENVHVAMFSTALGPFIGELMFRYAGMASGGEARITVVGVILALAFGLAAGFVVPALLPGTTAMHRGFNMYKAGLAIGIMGIFAYAFLYRTLGVEAPEVVTVHNEAYYAMPYGYRGFMNVFFLLLFSSTLLMGFLLNRRSFHGYPQLLRSTGYGVDFLNKFGMPVCLINFGVYGFCLLGYMNLIFILPELLPFLPQGVGFTGASVGVLFAALTFAADGQQPRTVAPIALGYISLLAVTVAFCLLLEREVPWTLSTQGYINGFAFATGLCAFSGKYGAKVSVLAGFLSAIICTSTAAMHGGLVLYNGGFNAGLTALVLLPVLDFYKIRPKFDDDTRES